MNYMDAMKKKLDENYKRMIQTTLNMSCRQHSLKQQLDGQLLPITNTIQVTRTRHVGHCWRSGDEFISSILQWTPSHVWARAGRSARTYILKLRANTGCRLEDLLGTIDDRDGWQEKIREICAGGATWWWGILS